MDREPSIPTLANIGFGQIVPALKIVLEGSRHRSELIALELSQASEHALMTVTAVLAAVALVLLGGFAGTFMVAAMVWDRPDRSLILGLVALVYFLGAGGLVWVTVTRVRKWRPFQESRTQLRSDNECLQTILAPGPASELKGHASA